jgi:hypothetical protein
LDHQDLEHQHGVERRPSALRAVQIRQRLQQIRAKNLEINGRRKGQQLIAEVAKPPQTLVDVEKSRLTPHRFVSRSMPERESERSQNDEVFRSVQLLGSAAALLALCGCNNTPQIPVDAAIVNPTPSPSGQPTLVTHQGSRLGVVFLPVSPGSSTALQIGSDRGLIVRSVLADGAAAQAGILEGDVLLSVDGAPRSILWPS